MLVDRIRLVRVFVIVSKLSKPRDSQIMAQPSSIHNGRNETLFTFNLYQGAKSHSRQNRESIFLPGSSGTLCSDGQTDGIHENSCPIHD
jgi:hypothetical protein